MKFYRQIKDDR